MTITLDYSDLQDEEPSHLITADALEFEFELLVALVVFRVDGTDFAFEEYTTLLEAAAIWQGRVNLLGDGEASTDENPNFEPSGLGSERGA